MAAKKWYSRATNDLLIVIPICPGHSQAKLTIVLLLKHLFEGPRPKTFTLI
jgi:hypothetical protein